MGSGGRLKSEDAHALTTKNWYLFQHIKLQYSHRQGVDNGSQQNLLLYLANEGFGQQDGDGIQLEDSATGAIILDGTEPTLTLHLLLMKQMVITLFKKQEQ